MTRADSPPVWLARRTQEPSLASLVLETVAPLESDVIDLSRSALHRTPGHAILEATAAALRAGATHYAGIPGLPELRKVLAQTLEQEGLSFNPDSEVITSAGSQEGLFASIMALVNAGDAVLVPNPGREDLPALVRLAGGEPVPYPCGAPPYFAFSAAAVADRLTAATRLVIVASPNDPTGTILGEELEGLATAVADHTCLVLTDETYRYLVWQEGSNGTPAVHPFLRERTVLLRSLGDAYGLAAWRIGYLAGPAALVSRILKLKQALSICANTAAQHAALAALRLPPDSPEGLGWLRRIQVDLTWFADELRQQGFAVNLPAGGPWLLVSDNRADLAGRLATRGVLVADGARYGTLTRGWVRVTWADRRELSRALPFFAAAKEA